MSDLSYQNGLLFIQAYKLVRNRVYAVLEPYGLNPSYWSILGAIMSAPDGIRSSNVAAIMDVKPPLITMLSNDLISMDLISRVPHPTDKRAKLLVLTAKGKKLSSKIEAQLTNEISSFVDGLGADEIQVFRKALETIIANAQ